MWSQVCAEPALSVDALLRLPLLQPRAPRDSGVVLARREPDARPVGGGVPAPRAAEKKKTPKKIISSMMDKLGRRKEPASPRTVEAGSPLKYGETATPPGRLEALARLERASSLNKKK